MDNPFTHVTEQLRSTSQLPALLSAAYVGLELAGLTTEALAEMCPEGELPGYLMAQTEAAQARDALAEAPSLNWPEATLPEDSGTSADVAASMAAMALVLTQALVTAAERSTDSADKVACLKAALHTGRLHEALR